MKMYTIHDHLVELIIVNFPSFLDLECGYLNF